MIYLDYNATAPLRSEVFGAMAPFLQERWGNPGSSYGFGSRLKSEIEGARRSVAKLVGANTSDVIFTGSATESDNTAIHAALLAQRGKKHIITSAVEHSAVLNYCRHLETIGFSVTYLLVNPEGLLKLQNLEDAICPDTAVVSLMWANNETGVLFPVDEIAQICQKRGILFHCDAVQAVGKIPISMKTVGMDYLTVSAHKLGGPKGVGALVVRRNAPFVPYIYGGHQEKGRRGSTENVAGIVGFGCAAELALKELPMYESKVKPLRDALEDGILTAGLNAELNGHKALRIPNTTNISFPSVDADALLLMLDHEGICASTGSACLSESNEVSYVIHAMKETTKRRNVIRFSLGSCIQMTDVERVVYALTQCMRNLIG
jgi:cysteine desulfurase